MLPIATTMKVLAMPRRGRCADLKAAKPIVDLRKYVPASENSDSSSDSSESGELAWAAESNVHLNKEPPALSNESFADIKNAVLPDSQKRAHLELFCYCTNSRE